MGVRFPRYGFGPVHPVTDVERDKMFTLPRRKRQVFQGEKQVFQRLKLKNLHF